MYIALYPICLLPYLRIAYTPIPARDSISKFILEYNKFQIRTLLINLFLYVEVIYISNL